FSLRYAGQHLPAFLRGHQVSAHRPYLADLAALEWAILEAFDAAEARPLASEELMRVPAERWPALRFQLMPSVQLLALDWAVYAVWEQMQRGDPPSVAVHEPTSLRVWRQDFRVFHRHITAAEHAALTALAGGATFAEMCEQMAARQADASPAAVAEHAAALVQQWLADAVLAGMG